MPGDRPGAAAPAPPAPCVDDLSSLAGFAAPLGAACAADGDAAVGFTAAVEGAAVAPALTGDVDVRRTLSRERPRARLVAPRATTGCVALAFAAGASPAALARAPVVGLGAEGAGPEEAVAGTTALAFGGGAAAALCARASLFGSGSRCGACAWRCGAFACSGCLSFASRCRSSARPGCGCDIFRSRSLPPFFARAGAFLACAGCPTDGTAGCAAGCLAGCAAGCSVGCIAGCSAAPAR